MDLEKEYDTIYRIGMWQMLRVYGVGGFRNVGLQGCVMSPWLFNVYMDGVVREVNV